MKQRLTLNIENAPVKKRSRVMRKKLRWNI